MHVSTRERSRTTDDVVDRWLAIAVDRLVRALDPERILLFGSFATGTAGRRSDLDLLVVWDTELSPVARIGHILELLSDAPRPIDVVVYTPREFAERSELPFLRHVVGQAKVLYERGETTARGEPLVPSS